MDVKTREAGENPRKADRQTPPPQAEGSLGEPTTLPLLPWASCPVYKGKGSSVFVLLGLSYAFLAPLVSRQGRGCLDGTAKIYLS